MQLHRAMYRRLEQQQVPMVAQDQAATQQQVCLM
jgi:hypothetical protein